MERIVIFCVIVIFYSHAYNLEDRLPLYKKQDDGTFGFSVAMHKTSSVPQTFVDRSLLVVGSPTAEALDSQQNAVNPGGIFYCPVTTDPNDCERVTMDTGPSTEVNNKSNQWLGVSVKSQGPGKYLVTCAHRHSQRFGTLRNEVERVCGKCFLLNGASTNALYEITPETSGGLFKTSPCEQALQSRAFPFAYKTGLAYTQAGVSVSLIDNEYLLGGPGAWAWSGGMFGYDLPNLNAESEFAGFGAETDEFATLGCREREMEFDPSKVSCDNIPLRRDSYMGFSVATSKTLDRNGGKDIYYVAGAPRGGEFKGAVVMYKKKQRSNSLTNDLIPLEDMVQGEHIGSSFGFSLATTDVNADGLDDLLVGAPQYYEYSDAGKHGGSVYVYVNDPNKPFSEISPQKLRGPLGSYYGYSIAPLGDIDQDGYNDFAVGAPYEKSGKVYIYRGSDTGKVEEAQTLDGANYVRFTKKMKGFGISLSGNVDIDNNKYPDLVVGSLKDQVVLFRSRPIIIVEASMEIRTQLLDLTNPNCTNAGKPYNCFDIQVCFRYNARHTEYTEELGIKYGIVLDGDLGMQRARFSTPLGNSSKQEYITLPSAGTRDCLGGFQRVYFFDKSLDRFNPISVDFKFSLASDEEDVEQEEEGKPVFRMISDPILDADYPNEFKEQVLFLNDCGDDGCQSNLRYGGSVPPEIVVGRSGKISLILNVSNDGEEAHQAAVSVKLPPRVYFDNYTVIESSGARIHCFHSDKGGSVKCELGNPYQSGSVDQISIELDVSSLTREEKRVSFEITGTTTSENPTLAPLTLYSDVIIELDLSLTGYGQPQQVRYGDSMIKGESAIVYTNEIGPLIKHTFIITNNGLQRATGLSLNVQFPQDIKNGKWLLYLVLSEVSAGQCSQTYVNPLKYKVPSLPRRAKRSETTPASLYKPQRVATSYSAGRYSSSLKLNCQDGSAQCISISCAIEPVQPRATASVFFQSRLWNATFLEEFRDVDLVDVEVYVELTNVESNVRISGDLTSQKVVTRVDHAFFQDDLTSVFPWWYILIAIVVALIVYVIIIFLLIKCGFFKRKRYPVRHTSDENVTLIEEKPRTEEDRA